MREVGKEGILLERALEPGLLLRVPSLVLEPVSVSALPSSYVSPSLPYVSPFSSRLSWLCASWPNNHTALMTKFYWY